MAKIAKLVTVTNAAHFVTPAKGPSGRNSVCQSPDGVWLCKGQDGTWARICGKGGVALTGELESGVRNALYTCAQVKVISKISSRPVVAQSQASLPWED